MDTPEAPEIKPIIEALIFAADGPLKLDRIAEVLDAPQSDVKEALKSLEDEYEAFPRGFFLQETAGGYQLRTRPEFADYLRRLGRSRPFKFSRPALESLAIIAYRQPITRPEVEYLRGVDSGSVIKTLLEKRLIRILGKKDVPGKPMIYGTTREFLELFGLSDLSALPTLREFNELIPEEEITAAEEAGFMPLLGEEGLSEEELQDDGAPETDVAGDDGQIDGEVL